MGQADLLRVIAAVNRHSAAIDAARKLQVRAKTTDVTVAMALALIDIDDVVRHLVSVEQ